MERALERCGYTYTEVPESADIETLLREAGFRIAKIDSLHQIYATDNQRMIKRFRNNREQIFATATPRAIRDIERLLALEEEFFKAYWWSGVLIVAHKN
jgi:cyclopropane fatty-acyl-phospholipid synthase-like methyltransferase